MKKVLLNINKKQLKDLPKEASYLKKLRKSRSPKDADGKEYYYLGYFVKKRHSHRALMPKDMIITTQNITVVSRNDTVNWSRNICKS